MRPQCRLIFFFTAADANVCSVCKTQGKTTPANSWCSICNDVFCQDFCQDCKMAICHTCCSLKHRQCDDVDALDSMTTIVKEKLSNENHELKINMTASEKRIILKKSQIKEVKTNAQNIKVQIRKLRERRRSHFKEIGTAS